RLPRPASGGRRGGVRPAGIVRGAAPIRGRAIVVGVPRRAATTPGAPCPASVARGRQRGTPAAGLRPVRWRARGLRGGPRVSRSSDPNGVPETVVEQQFPLDALHLPDQLMAGGRLVG